MGSDTPQITCRRRQPARFVLESYSPAFQEETTWRVRVSESGVLARRQDGRELSISWRELLGAAMVYGRDRQGSGSFDTNGSH